MQCRFSLSLHILAVYLVNAKECFNLAELTSKALST